MSFVFTEELFAQSNKSRYMPEKVKFRFVITNIVVDEEKKKINVTGYVLDGENVDSEVIVSFSTNMMTQAGKFNPNAMEHLMSLYKGFVDIGTLVGQDLHKLDYSKWLGQIYSCVPSKIEEKEFKGAMFKNQYMRDVTYEGPADDATKTAAKIADIPF
jgi:hypothetical protein